MALVRVPPVELGERWFREEGPALLCGRDGGYIGGVFVTHHLRRTQKIEVRSA